MTLAGLAGPPAPAPARVGEEGVLEGAAFLLRASAVHSRCVCKRLSRWLGSSSAELDDKALLNEHD